MADAHAGITVRCPGEVGEPEETEQEFSDGTTRTVKQVPRCQTKLTWEEHGQFVRTPPGEVRDRFEQSALKFTCPDCGHVTWKCPVCSDPDENTPPGWFRGEDTGEQLPCHNCNAEEVARQRMEM